MSFVDFRIYSFFSSFAWWTSSSWSHFLSTPRIFQRLLFTIAGERLTKGHSRLHCCEMNPRDRRWNDSSHYYLGGEGQWRHGPFVTETTRDGFTCLWKVGEMTTSYPSERLPWTSFQLFLIASKPKCATAEVLFLGIRNYRLLRVSRRAFIFHSKPLNWNIYMCVFVCMFVIL